MLKPKIVKFLHESNLIEGIQTGLEDYNNPETPHLHVKNSLAAWNYVVKHSKHRMFDLEDVLQIHKNQMLGLLSPKETGQLRKVQVYVGRHVPPSPEEVPFMMIQFLDHFSWTDPMTMHYQFELIHPFIDGNGRTGRLLWAWALLYRKLPVHPILDLYEGDSFKDRRYYYYCSLERYEKRAEADL